MPSKRFQRLQQIRQIAEERGWPEITPRCFDVLLQEFPEVSRETLRHDLRDVALKVHPLVEGVRLDSLDQLERTLLALVEWERIAREAKGGSTKIRNEARLLVLDARQKAELVLRKHSITQEAQEAMTEKRLWIRTWLENPSVFPQWRELRRRATRNP